MKRFIRLVVLQLVLLSFVAGCGSKNTPAEPPDNPAPPPKKGPAGSQPGKDKNKYKDKKDTGTNTLPPPPPLEP